MEWNIALPDAEWYDRDSPGLDGLIREVLDQDVCAIDTETQGLKVWKDLPLFWSLSWGPRRICMPAELLTLGCFKYSFADETKRWAFANAKFDMHMLANVGVEFAGDCIDTAVMHALLYEEDSHSLKDMAKQILGWRWTDFFDTFNPLMVPDLSKPMKTLRGGKQSQPMRRESIQEMLERCRRDEPAKLTDYASNDAYGTLQLYYELKKKLEGQFTYSLYPEDYATMADVFFKTEAPFTKVLYRCERNGIFVNQEYLAEKKGPMVEECNKLRKEMGRLSGNMGFNPNSVEQLRDYFKGKGLEPLMYTKGGKSGVKQPSIDKGFLEHYAEQGDEMCTAILSYRKLDKLMGTYINGAGEFIDPRSRIHTRFNQDVARTGRLSSSDPNLQNIPTTEKDKFLLRGAFQATPAHFRGMYPGDDPGEDTELIVGDYAQLEMRLLACATVTTACPKGAEEMIQIFLDGKDIHMGNAAMVYGPIYKRKYGWDLTYDFIKEAKKIDGKVKSGELPPSAKTVQHEQALFARNAIKSVGFGLNYGMKEKKLARQLGITEEEAHGIIEAYLGTYPAVKQFYADAIKDTQEDSYSFTLLGRRRYHPAINSSNKMDRWSEERKATNLTIQGTAADAVRLAMINISRARLDYKYGCHMLLQIHDELVFECPKSTRAQAQAEIKAIMEHPFKTDLAVPLDVSIGSGPRWDKAK
jgi:DNA polymerase-1